MGKDQNLIKNNSLEGGTRMKKWLTFRLFTLSSFAALSSDLTEKKQFLMLLNTLE